MSAYDGYNVTVFTHGGSGSGKTYTMGIEKEDGIIPLTISQLFSDIQNHNV